MRAYLIGFIFLTLLVPFPALALPPCYSSDWHGQVVSAARQICVNATLDNPTDDSYCLNRTFPATDIKACEFSADRASCFPRNGVTATLCEHNRARGTCEGECPSSPSGPTELQEIQSEPEAAAAGVILPRLQIPVPSLQLFTRPQLYQEGETVFLDIGFIGQYIVGLYQYLVGLVGILAGVMYVWAGVRWLTSAGDPEKISEAKKKIAGATVGLILVLGSYLVLYLVNPALTIFKPLRIEYVKREIIVFDDKPNPDFDAPPTPAGNYDSLFQKYANCVGIDWRVLRMIAQKESGLNPNLVNRAGFIGLFQTKPVYCGSALPAQFEDRCTEGLLKNPAVNTAVGTRQQRNTLKLIDELCPSGDARAKFTIVYGVLNSGLGATRSAIKYANQLGGCTTDNLRAGLTQFWKNHKGGATARWFVGYHGASRCANYADELDCMGAEKYNHTLKMADALIAQGVTQVRAEPTGVCPLDTENPFPAS